MNFQVRPSSLLWFLTTLLSLHSCSESLHHDDIRSKLKDLREQVSKNNTGCIQAVQGWCSHGPSSDQLMVAVKQQLGCPTLTECRCVP